MNAIGSITTDALGSHFVVHAPPGSPVAKALARRAGGMTTAFDGGVALPAVPRAVPALHSLTAEHPGLALEPSAERLLTELERLPATATGVAHACEHRPGRPGVVVVPEDPSDVALAAAMDALPEVRRDAALTRWWIPTRRPSLEALEACLSRHARLTATDAVRARLQRFVQPSLTVVSGDEARHTCRLEVREGPDGETRVGVCRRCHPDLPTHVTGPIGRSSDAWWLPISSDTPAVLARLGLSVDDRSVERSLQRAAGRAADLEALEALSQAREGHIAVNGVYGRLRPFQRAAVEYAVRTRRTFLADEPGLGKTIQALAALEVAGAFPALIVCPASLRLTWAMEARRWLAERSVALLDAEQPVDSAALSIVSYDMLHRFEQSLSGTPPAGLVLDEAHSCKNPRARRTQAALRIADAMADDAMVLLLTGTPVVNRPEELEAQLRILGRLNDLGGPRRMRNVYAEGRELDVLHRQLRRRCFVRRRKADVLPQLPAKQRVVVPIDVQNRAEYRAIEANVGRWLCGQAERDARFDASIADLTPKERDAAIRERGRTAELRARRAESLVRLNQLSMAAARGKLSAACEWIDSFLDSQEKLVVFCRHREIGDALLTRFPTAVVVTGRLPADRRSAEVERFQTDPAVPLAVCSLDAAGVGLTMTAASNVAFIEMGWTPAILEQAEDRVHRIGQRESVTAWYLLAARTIDEQIAEVVERKRRLVRAASDGLPAGGADDEDTLYELLEIVRARLAST